MSDNWIAIIPSDPRYTPSDEDVVDANRLVQKAFPQADGIEIIMESNPRLFDCGTNLNSIRCPICSETITIDWWIEHVELDANGRYFRLNQYSVPCCGADLTLNDLTYHWPQGFAQFAIDIMNPNVDHVPPDVIAGLEKVLKSNVKVVYRHL